MFFARHIQHNILYAFKNTHGSTHAVAKIQHAVREVEGWACKRPAHAHRALFAKNTVYHITNIRVDLAAIPQVNSVFHTGIYYKDTYPII